MAWTLVNGVYNGDLAEAAVNDGELRDRLITNCDNHSVLFNDASYWDINRVVSVNTTGSDAVSLSGGDGGTLNTVSLTTSYNAEGSGFHVGSAYTHTMMMDLCSVLDQQYTVLLEASTVVEHLCAYGCNRGAKISANNCSILKSKFFDCGRVSEASGVLVDANAQDATIKDTVVVQDGNSVVPAFVLKLRSSGLIERCVIRTSGSNYAIHLFDDSDASGWQIDNNIYIGTPTFLVDGVEKDFSEWQALGFDTNGYVVT